MLIIVPVSGRGRSSFAIASRGSLLEPTCCYVATASTLVANEPLGNPRYKRGLWLGELRAASCELRGNSKKALGVEFSTLTYSVQELWKGSVIRELRVQNINE